MMKKGIGLLAILTVVYFVFDPAGNRWFPKCPFLWLTGLKCPGCGSQRAVHNLLHGELAAAFGYNALLVVSIPFVLLLAYAEWKRNSRPVLYNRLHRTWLVWACFVVVCLWGVCRNLFGY